MHNPSHHLAFHAAIVLLFGVLLGAPYARAINRQAPQQVVNSWRVAHQSLPIAAGLMFAVAGVLPRLTAPAASVWFVVVALTASTYAFCVSMPLAAITRHRGLAPDGKGLQRVVFYGNLVGAWLSVAACLGLVFVTAASL
jgi:hypothetical protein